ncbi:MAG: TonB-dependent receptor [Chitinophagaceae bacterium]|nr:TonB-dependent receptor [Chitinophagaceae bacterium]MCW5927744.1 TonB-dependent receptor [Chitinophagaceae bacterium]
MNFLTILLLACCLQISAHVNSQGVTLNVKKAPLDKVFREIREQTGYTFMYTETMLKESRKVSMQVKNVSLREVLAICFAEQPFTYNIIDKTVVVQPREAAAVNIAADTAVTAQPPPVEISGRVVNNEGEPLSNVSVLIVGTKTGTVTDVNGYFKLTAPDNKNITLEISSVGYQAKRVNAGKQTEINVVLEVEASSLIDVVVVGYGTQKKANLTGAVASISGEALENKPLPNVGEVLRGVSPNLNINLGAYGAEPGATLGFNIRGVGSISGNSAPLILVDGVEMDINNLDPGTIESVSVLKDASSSAIYGSRAPFGVILITTKKGRKNEGVKIQYNNNLIFGKPIGIPHMENSLIFATVYNQTAINAGSPPTFTDEQVQRIKGFMDGTYKTEFDPQRPTTSIFEGRRIGNANYDWPHILFKDHKFDQRHNVAVSGGSDKSQYYISLGYFDQGGFYGFGYDAYKRYDLLANLSTQATQWLKFSLSTKYAHTYTDYPIGVTTVERRYIGNTLFSFGPNTPWYNPNGSVANPVIRYLEGSGRDKTRENDLLVTLGAEIEPIKGWKTNFSYNHNFTEADQGKVSIPVMVELGNGKFGNIGKPNSAYESTLSRSSYALANVVTSYERKLGEHYIKVLAGYEQEERIFNSLYGRKENLISEAVPSINTALGGSTLKDARNDWATQGIFGRINYNFKEKYLLEFSARYNGSSRFDPDSRWGFFPSASAGYQISSENFWEAIQPVVNRLKIRGSYGSLGNQNVANYLYIPTINVNPETPWIIGNARPPYASTPAIISDNLTWETITMANLGIDASFLANRLSLTFDVFNRKTTNMFGPQATLPYTLGTGTPTANNASLSTKGFELVLDWNDRIGSEFSYHAQISLGDNRSKILQYRNESGFIDDWYNGKNIGEIWGFVTDGLIQTSNEKMPDQTALYPNWGPGDMKYVDLSGDDKITEGTRTLKDHGDLKIIGNTTPRYNIGIVGGFNYKGLDFSMNWSGSLKQDYLPKLTVTTFWGVTQDWALSSVFKGSPVLDYWRPADETNILGPNTDAYFPKPYFSNETLKNRKPQSKYVLNAAYLRLRNIQLGYTLPGAISKKVAVQKARVFVSGGNLITIKSLPKNIDPEQTIVGEKGYNNNGSFYPMSATLTIGVNLTF